MTTIQIFVNGTKNSIELLRFLRKHINMITNFGISLDIRRVSRIPGLVQQLEMGGIRRLPAMLARGEPPVIGARRIISIFEKNIKLILQQQRDAVIAASSRGAAARGPPAEKKSDACYELCDNPDLSKMWMDEIVEMKDGKRVFKRDDDIDPHEDDRADINRRMATFLTSTGNRNSGVGAGVEGLEGRAAPDSAELQAPQRRGIASRTTQIRSQSEDFGNTSISTPPVMGNIPATGSMDEFDPQYAQESQEATRGMGGPIRAEPTGNTEDDNMMARWLENMSATDEY